MNGFALADVFYSSSISSSLGNHWSAANWFSAKRFFAFVVNDSSDFSNCSDFQICAMTSFIQSSFNLSMSPAVKRAYFKIFVEGEEEVGDVKDFFENRETILAAVAIVAFVGEALSAYKKLLFFPP